MWRTQQPDRPRWGVCPLLALLVVSCVLPGLLGGLLLLVQQYREGQRQLHSSTLQTARVLAQAVDSQILRAQAVGQVLATSAWLASGDLAAFHQRARDAVTASSLITNVVLSDESGQQLVNTAIDYGHPLPRRADPQRLRAIFTTGQPVITPVVIGGLLKRPIFGIDVPVRINGRIVYSLGVGILPERFNELLQGQRLPPDWVVGVFDGSGTVMARSRAPERFVGTKASLLLLRSLAARAEGVVEATTLEGIDVLTFHTRAPTTGWSVAIGIPRSALTAELYRTLSLLAAGVTALFAAGLLLARFLGKRIAQSFMALTAPAQALGEGRFEVVPAVHVSEAAAVASAMASAAKLLRQREAALHAQQQRLAEHVAARTAELEHARRDLKNILDALPSLISYWDRDLINRFANAAVRKWLGLEPDAPRRPHLREVLGETLYAQSLPYAQAALRGEPQHFERSFPRPDSQGLRHSVSYYLPDVVDGKVLGFYSLIHDVTEIVESRRALDMERQRLHDILRDTQVATWEWNVQTGELRVNERWAEIIGYRLEELQPLSIDTWMRFAHPEDRERSGQLLEQHFRGELDHYECEARMRNRDGHWVWVRDSGRVTTWGDDGKPLWMHGIHQDITARKALEKALHERTRQAEAASLAKSAFLANMSHEIRTPMNAILSLAHLLAQDGLAPHHAQQIARIESAGQPLLSIINDILDLSRIEAGKLQLEERNFSLAALLEQVRSIVGDSATAKGLAVDVDTGDVPAWLLGDETRVRQALLNYAGNAVKFTAAGGITLRTRLQERREDRLLVRFEVEDTGVGIRPQQIERLFEAFEQADVSTTREHGGTGLGLAITRRLAELMGGNAGAQPREGGGSVFWFTAWLEEGAGARVPEAMPARADAVLRERHAGARVLVAEDHPVNREIALAQLRAVALEVDFAEDGRAAVDKAGHGHYDLVLMDMQMPVMDGLAATQALRALPGLQDLPILAMTANAFGDDRAACLAAGMNDFVCKPVEPQTLYATLLKWLDRGHEQT